MHEEADKNEFISKFLTHINLGDEYEMIKFNSKTSHIYFAAWVFLFISLISILFFPKYFPFYQFFLNSNLVKASGISHDNIKSLMFIASFLSLIKSYSIWIQRKELIQSLFGLRILLEYMRVDEISFFNNLKLIFPKLEDYEIAEFTNTVFINKVLIKKSIR